MTGHQKAQQLKKPSSSGMIRSQSTKQLGQQPASDQQPPSIVTNVDDLAREKLQEIEESLKNNSASDSNIKEFTTWFLILKQIITAADLHRTNDDKNNRSQTDVANGKSETGDSIYADYSDDNEQFTTQVDLSERFATNSVKWTIRVRAFKIVHRLVRLVIETSHEICVQGALFNNKPAKVLVVHLPDLVRLSFVAATSPYDELKMQGFEMFKVLIETFASHEESEFPGHSILEQYKTQFLSAVKPAFNLDSPPYITAIASQICSLWICQGLEKDLCDVKRTYQLMLLSIQKLEGQSANQHSKLYTESELEQERVDILGAWALLYISSRESDLPEQHARISRLSQPDRSYLNSLVESQIEILVAKWWEAMKDYALLIMPAPRFIGISHDNEHVYTREVALSLFAPTWPKLVFALSIWLCDEYGKSSTKYDQKEQDALTNNDNSEERSFQSARQRKYCQFLCGIIMKELSSSLVDKPNPKKVLTQSTVLSLRSINHLTYDNVLRDILHDNFTMAQEFYRVLYHLAVFHVRDPNRLLVRQIMDSLFDIIVHKISKSETEVHYGVARLISSLMSALRDLTIAADEKSTIDLDIARLHLSVRLRNLLVLTKSALKFFEREVPLQVAFVVIFQELLRFEREPAVIVTSADQLKEFLPQIVDKSLQANILDQLYPELCARVGTILSALFISDKYSEVDKLHLSQVDSLLKSMRLMLASLDLECRKEKVELYVTCTLTTLESFQDCVVDWVSDGAKKKRELIDFIINQNSALRDMYPDAELTSKAQHMLKFGTELQQDIKIKIKSKNQKHIAAAKNVTSQPKVAKIALKADFSNFYAKKTDDVATKRNLGTKYS